MWAELWRYKLLHPKHWGQACMCALALHIPWILYHTSFFAIAPSPSLPFHPFHWHRLKSAFLLPHSLSASFLWAVITPLCPLPLSSTLSPSPMQQPSVSWVQAKAFKYTILDWMQTQAWEFCISSMYSACTNSNRYFCPFYTGARALLLLPSLQAFPKSHLKIIVNATPHYVF